MPRSPFRFTGFMGGLYAGANTFDQPKGTLPRVSNLVFTERGGLFTVDGSHVISRPGPGAAAIAFASSGLVAAAAPAVPTIPSAPTVEFNFTGDSTISGSPTLPLDLTVNLPSGLEPGDVLIAVVTVKGIFPGFGDSMTAIDAVAGWTIYTTLTGVAQTSDNILYHVVDGTEGADVTFSYNGPPGAFAGFQINAAIFPVRGANPIAPIDVVEHTSATTAGPTAVMTGATTVFANDLLLLVMQPVNDNANQGGAGHITPGNIASTVLQFNQQSAAGALIDTLAAWSKAFAGPGSTGNFTSTSGWPLTVFDGLVIAIAAGISPDGQLMGFPIDSDGVITPAPIISGEATALTAPQGTFRDSTGKLWTADAQSGNAGAIIGYTTPATDVGNVAPNVKIQGPTNTLLDMPYDVGIDSASKIYVANFGSGIGAILIFASGADGDVAPSSEISGGTTTLTHPRAVCLDSSNNVYVLDDGVGTIKIWNAGNVGNVAPDRTISGANTGLDVPLAMRIDPNGLLWVTCKGATGTAFLLAFNSTDSGNVAPQVRIDSAALQPQLGFDGPTGIAFDSDANVYVANLGNKNVTKFVAGSSGTVDTPDATISGFPNGPWGIGIQQS